MKLTTGGGATAPQPAKKPSSVSKPSSTSSSMSRVEKMKAKLLEVKSKSSGDIFNLPEGKSTIRLLPPIEDEGDWYFEAAYHYRMGPENNNAVACPRLMLKKPCPICKKMDELKAGDEEDKKIARQLFPKSRVFANAFIPGVGVKVFAFGKGVFESLLGFFIDPEWGMLDDIEQGHNITIVKSGSGFNTEYEVRPQPRSKPLEDVLGDELTVDEALEQRKNLVDVVEVKTLDDIEELLEATDLSVLLKKSNPQSSEKKKGGKKGASSDSEE